MTLLVYLIHVAERDGRLAHYVGLAHADRMLTRFREHASGNGARVLRQPVLNGARLTCVRQAHVTAPEAERNYMRFWKGGRGCPLCHPTVRPVTTGFLVKEPLPMVTLAGRTQIVEF